ncbi:MAG: sporulation protein [Paenibacillus sp.]|nr:sporulation protein [Paenibacillus sp.]
MRKRKLAYVLVALCMTIVLAACSDLKSRNADSGAEQSKLFAATGNGYVVHKSNSLLLVTAYIEKADGKGIDAYAVMTNEKTALLDSSGKTIVLADIGVGAQVEVWVAGPIRESYPAQADAAKIVLLDDRQPAPDGMIGRAAAIQAALQTKEMQTATVANAVKSVSLDAGNGYWNVELVQHERIGQPVAVRIDARKGSVLQVPVAQNDAFRLFSPKPGTEIAGSKLTVEGEARVFEAAFSWTLEDGHNILAEGHEMADGGAPAWGRFSFDISFGKASQPNVTLLLFVHSAKDGSVQNQLVVPLKVSGDRVQYNTSP